jgi:hypothetical protein
MVRRDRGPGRKGAGMERDDSGSLPPASRNRDGRTVGGRPTRGSRGGGRVRGGVASDRMEREAAGVSGRGGLYLRRVPTCCPPNGIRTPSSPRRAVPDDFSPHQAAVRPSAPPNAASRGPGEPKIGCGGRFGPEEGGRSRDLARRRGDGPVSNPWQTSKSVRDTQQGASR